MLVLRAARKSGGGTAHTPPKARREVLRGTEGKGSWTGQTGLPGRVTALPQTSTHGQEPPLPIASMEPTGVPCEGGALGMGSSRKDPRDQPRGSENFCPARAFPPPISRAQYGLFKSPTWAGQTGEWCRGTEKAGRQVGVQKGGGVTSI